MPLTKRKAVFPRSILLFVAFYLVAAISAAIAQSNWEFLRFYIPFFFVASAIVMFMNARVKFTHTTLWCLTIWGVLHLAGGLVQLPSHWRYDGDNAVLYSLWLAGSWFKYDHLVHIFGFGTCTWLAWEALRSSIQSRLGRRLYPSFGMITLCILTGMGLGALNEIVEFVAVLNLPNTNVGGYFNTGWDLVSNLVGCLAAGVIIYFFG